MDEFESGESQEKLESQFEELSARSEDCFQKCQIRSAMRIAKEMTRFAKTHGNAIFYMRGLFDQMRFGHGLLNPVATREVSVELVLLLEDEEQARRIQPNLDEGYYNWVCSWMSTCAYDNLAEATAMISGYNSEGMHSCIAEGLQVCRQTGKTECIKCFREYASDVYMASDDLEMVRHQCQSLLEYKADGSDNKDRRWSGHHKLAKIALLEGRLEYALSELQRAWEMAVAEDVYLKLRAKLLVALTLDEALMLAGKPRFDWSTQAAELPEPGEWPYFELLRTLTEALHQVLNSEYESAIQSLTEWDRQLTEQNCLKEWFEVRLRLIAAYLLKGDRKRAESLAKGLEAKADEAQDYLTLRRYKRLLDSQLPVSPIAALATASSSQDSDISAAAAMAEDSGATPSTGADHTATAEDEEETPLGEVLNGYMLQMAATQQDEEARRTLLDQILSHVAADVDHPQDAAHLVHLSQFLVRGSEEALPVWRWAEALLQRHSEDHLVLSVVAALGNYFRTADPDAFPFLTSEQLRNWFKRSLAPQVQRARNFARAGSFFLDEEDYGEAERCFSRAFRLDRTESSIVLPLADLYRQSDRPRDALAVLDLSLREGNDDAMVAWEAAMTALQLEQYDSVLTYLDKYLELGEPQAWVHYYRGLALGRLGRFEESLQEIELERQFEPPGEFHLHSISICSLVPLGRMDEARSLLRQVLDTSLVQIDYLSLHGIERMLNQLLKTVSESETFSTDPLLDELEELILATGLAPDAYFDQLRQQNEVAEAVYFFRVHLKQPLGENWSTTRGCLPGQAEWTEYELDWGVLAVDEEEAVQRVLEFQSRCCEQPATVVEVTQSEEDYQDRPGVVWQGMRWSDSSDDEIEESLE